MNEETFREDSVRQLEARQLFCHECGYGVVTRRDPPQCPMFRAHDWREGPSFARWN